MLPRAIRTADQRQGVGRLSYRYAKAVEVVKVARLLVQQMRHTGMKGHYVIPPEVVLRLCVAIDEHAEKGGEEEWD
jgi:hypothetical protein